MSSDENGTKMRKHLISAYLDKMTNYLSYMFPDKTENEIRTFVENKVKDQCNMMIKNLQDLIDGTEDYDIDDGRTGKDKLWPTVQILRYVNPTEHNKYKHSCGNISYQKQEELLEVLNGYKEKIMSPFGSFYETPDKQQSFFKGMIDIKMKQRKTEKKAMLKCKKSGDKAGEVYHNNKQATIKIITNSIIGCTGCGNNFVSSISNFNSVTSISRFFVMNAYAHGERFLEGNFYFPSEESVISFILDCKTKGPDFNQVEKLARTYKLYIPDTNDVYQFLVKNLHRYTFISEHEDIRILLSQCSCGELIFIYYVSNLKNIFQENNSELFKSWIAEFIDLRNSLGDLSEISPEDVAELDGDLVTVLTTICQNFIPRNKKGNSLSAYDCINEAPEIAKRLAYIGRLMTDKMNQLWKLLKIFFDHNVEIANVIDHKNMFRDAIISSDTDSIIFTTKSWIEWYTGELKINELGFIINSIVVYFLSKATAFVLKHLSASVGTNGKDNLVKMNMKNEFTMSIDILTSLKKHYMSLLNIQEGVFFGTPRPDFKGVGIRGSNFVKLVLNYVDWFINQLFSEILTEGKVNIQDKIYDVLCFERMIYDSLNQGNTEFLNVEPIKTKDEYKDSDRSVYFNYLFWEKVFAEKYGSIQIPTKCFVLPLTNLRSTDYEAYLLKNYPDIHRSLKAFLTDNPDKNITRIPINPMTETIPEELKPITNYRSIIYSNTRPLFLIMKSFGVALGTLQKHTNLFSDIYGWVSEEDGLKARDHI